MENSRSKSISIHLGDGNAGFTGAGSFSLDDYPYSLAIGDLDGNGHPDMAAAIQTARVSAERVIRELLHERAADSATGQCQIA